MTTIACNHKEMAADSLTQWDGTKWEEIKILRVGNAIIGTAGSSKDTPMFCAWYVDQDKKKPKLGNDFQGMVLRPDGVYLYDANCDPVRVERGFHAIGSGEKAALAAMLCGKRPKDAVEVACKVDAASGLPVHVLRL
jgi:hypothetical protein